MRIKLSKKPGSTGEKTESSRWFFKLMIASILVLFCSPLLQAEEAADLEPAPVQEAVEFNDQLGKFIPEGISLINEKGETVLLKDFIDKPTILSLVYYECPGICTPLLDEVADVMGKTNLDPKKTPFQLLTVSFNPTDTSEMAAGKQKNYLKLLSKPYPQDTWRFFTGDAENIKKLTDAVGFHYKKVGFEYIHPGGLILISPQGKIVRYLYGLKFLPFDFQMGIIEAMKGKVTPTTARLLQYCFSYDPAGRTYVFNIARVVGSVMLISIVFFAGFLVFVTRKMRG
jgi:protein SCO1